MLEEGSWPIDFAPRPSPGAPFFPRKPEPTVSALQGFAPDDDTFDDDPFFDGVAFLVFTFAFNRSRIVLPGFAAIIICLFYLCYYL